MQAKSKIMVLMKNWSLQIVLGAAGTWPPQILVPDKFSTWFFGGTEYSFSSTLTQKYQLVLTLTGRRTSCCQEDGTDTHHHILSRRALVAFLSFNVSLRMTDFWVILIWSKTLIYQLNWQRIVDYISKAIDAIVGVSRGQQSRDLPLA